MKTVTMLAVAAAVLTIGIAPADAAQKRDTNYVQREASCKAQAAKKFSAIRFLARRDFVNKCMNQTSTAKAMKPKKNNEPATTGQSNR